MNRMPKVMIVFQRGGENGGPYTSHLRILNSCLKEKYEFIPLYIPKGRIGIYNPKLQKCLCNEIQKVQPDIIHTAGLQLIGYQTVKAAKHCKVPCVLAVHGSSTEAITLPKWKKKILSVLESYSLKRAAAVYTVSRYIAQWKSIKKCKNFAGVVYNLPEQVKDLPNKESLRAQYGIDNDSILVVSTGRITREKGFDILWKAIQSMQFNKKVHFIIAGDGEFLPTWKEELQQSVWKNNVHLLGYKNNVNDILAISDIFIICTLHETLCNSAIEAGFFSLPIIASKVGGLPEIVDNETSGLLVAPIEPENFAKALRLLIEDKDKREEYGRNAKIKIDTVFSETANMQKVDLIYQNLLKKK